MPCLKQLSKITVSPWVPFFIILYFWMRYLITKALGTFLQLSDLESVQYIVFGVVLCIVTVVLYVKARSAAKVHREVNTIFAHRRTSVVWRDNPPEQYKPLMDDWYNATAVTLEASKHRSRHTKLSDLYWFNRPHFLLIILQIDFYLQAFVLCWAMYDNVRGGKAYYWYILNFAVTFANIGVLIPMLVGQYVKGAFTGDLIEKVIWMQVWKSFLKHTTEAEHKADHAYYDAEIVLEHFDTRVTDD